ILAFLPLERQEEILQHTQLVPLTPKTITNPAILREEFKKARAQGCAVSFGEWVEDASGVASPILARDGNVVGALAISGPTSRFTDENVAKYRDAVKRVAVQISESLGYNAG
ncbi:MAG: IclR family transcriptional regulator, partial [Anaerolineaceae bacterium]|nr:IclR family transcriptional regulator [Anaerolineaceae bacterium]